MKIAYFGTPIFSARFLMNLLERSSEVGFEVDLVVTQPDKPVGRKQVMTASPVKQVAEKRDIEIFDKPLRKNIENAAVLEARLAEIDLVVLFAYGEIISDALLNAPRHGFWNIHPSLLPKFRGASPTVYPLILGHTETGVTLMQMDADLDHGPIIGQSTYTIGETEKNFDVINALTDKAVTLTLEMWSAHFHSELKSESSRATNIEASDITTEQDHSQATFTRTLTRQDGFIELEIIKKALNQPEDPVPFNELPALIQDYFKHNKLAESDYKPQTYAQLVYNMWRGLDPWPGIWTLVEVEAKSDEKSSGNIKKRLKLTELSLENGKLDIKTGQIEGKKPTPFAQINEYLRIF